MSALDIQVGGGHYKSRAMQPIEYCQKNQLNACETSIIKYATRWRDKGGVEDLRKSRHYVQLLRELSSSNIPFISIPPKHYCSLNNIVGLEALIIEGVSLWEVLKDLDVVEEHINRLIESQL